MRCFLICGPESAGNRLVASVLVRAGVYGAGALSHAWNQDELPNGESPAVLIRSLPHGGRWPPLAAVLGQLEDRGYAVTVLVTARHPVALAGSQQAWGHVKESARALAQAQQAYRRLFRLLPDRVPIYIVPYEALVLDPEAAVAALLRLLGLPQQTKGPLVIEGEERELTNENQKHYGVAA